MSIACDLCYESLHGSHLQSHANVFMDINYLWSNRSSTDKSLTQLDMVSTFTVKSVFETYDWKSAASCTLANGSTDVSEVGDTGWRGWSYHLSVTGSYHHTGKLTRGAVQVCETKHVSRTAHWRSRDACTESSLTLLKAGNGAGNGNGCAGEG